MKINDDGTIDLSWADADRIRDLAFERDFGEVPLNDLSLDAVVGIVRGGVIPATILSHQLGVKMHTLNYSARQDPTRMPTVDFTPEQYKRILVIDDIADEGYTFKNIRQFLMEQGFCVFTATLTYKPESIFKPDYIRYVLPYNSGWVTFSWEHVDQLPQQNEGVEKW